MSVWKHLSPVLGTAVMLGLLAAPLVAQDDAPERNRKLIALVDSFLQYPTPGALPREIMQAAMARADVTVNLKMNLLPFECTSDTASRRGLLNALLTTAYIAGNMREQLRTGHNGDQPAAGLRAELSVYSLLRARDPNFRVPELEAWGQVGAADRLSAIADSLAGTKDTPCDYRSR